MKSENPTGDESPAFTPNDGDAQPEDNQSSSEPRFKTDWGEISEEEVRQAFTPDEPQNDGAANTNDDGSDSWPDIDGVEHSVSGRVNLSPVNWGNVPEGEKDREFHDGQGRTEILLEDMMGVRLHDPLEVHDALSEWSQPPLGHEHEFLNEAGGWAIDAETLDRQGEFLAVEITVSSENGGGEQDWNKTNHWLTIGEPVRIRTDRLEDLIRDIQLHFSSLNIRSGRTAPLTDGGGGPTDG